MRLLGIDYGTKRVGVALTDERGTMAFPHSVLQNDGELVQNLVTLVESENVGKIVIGHSLDNAGAANAAHEGARELMDDLTLHTGLPIELEPEQYSTQEAKRLQGKTDKTDASAAAIILNSFITKQKNT